MQERKLFNCLLTTLQQYLKLDMLTLRQMSQRLSIALAQVKIGNTSEDLLNEIMHIAQLRFHAYFWFGHQRISQALRFHSCTVNSID